MVLRPPLSNRLEEMSELIRRRRIVASALFVSFFGKGDAQGWVANASVGHKISFLEPRLTSETAALAQSRDAAAHS